MCSMPHEGRSPSQRIALQRANDGVDHQAKDAVDQQADNDYISAHEVPRITGQITDASGGVDLLDKDQGQPRNTQ